MDYCISQIFHGKNQPSKRSVENGSKLQVVVIDYDDNKKRISLGLKQLQPHPWDSLPEGIRSRCEK